jgi:3-isopropylmalate/(R)-2-methylmalate dehydratase small subunit
MPEAVQALTSKVIVLSQANIDTDQIIPARFLTTTSREGLGQVAFYDWRYETDGSHKPDAVLNRIDPAERRILLAGPNFACGSSREHAPWALVDFGIRAVISTSIADIFTANALKIGLIPIEVDQATWDQLAAFPDRPVTVDLEALEIRTSNAAPTPFTLERFARRCLLGGVDTLGWLLDRLPDILAFEAAHEVEAV